MLTAGRHQLCRVEELTLAFRLDQGVQTGLVFDFGRRDRQPVLSLRVDDGMCRRGAKSDNIVSVGLVLLDVFCQYELDIVDWALPGELVLRVADDVLFLCLRVARASSIRAGPVRRTDSLDVKERSSTRYPAHTNPTELSLVDRGPWINRFTSVFLSSFTLLAHNHLVAVVHLNASTVDRAGIEAVTAQV